MLENFWVSTPARVVGMSECRYDDSFDAREDEFLAVNGTS